MRLMQNQKIYFRTSHFIIADDEVDIFVETQCGARIEPREIPAVEEHGFDRRGAQQTNERSEPRLLVFGV